MWLLHRGKSKDNGNWVRGYVWHGSNCAVIIPSNVGVGYDKYIKKLTAPAIEIDPDTLGVISNKTDFYCNTISEHDIVKANFSGTEHLYEVALRDGAFGLVWKYMGRENFAAFSSFVSNTVFERVGNRFDNPELLKEVYPDE